MLIVEPITKGIAPTLYEVLHSLVLPSIQTLQKGSSCPTGRLRGGCPREIAQPPDLAKLDIAAP